MKVSLELGADFYPWIQKVESSGVYGNFGPQVAGLESELASLIGLPASTVVTVANATLGLQGALVVMGIERWVVPSWTFAATIHAANAAVRSFEFGEVDRSSWVLNPMEVSQGEGALVTAPFGARISIGQEWNHVAGLVIDAAAAIGAFPQFVGSYKGPWAAVVSMHATKVLGIGEGGFVAFSDPSLATSFRQWTNFGFFGARVAEIYGTNAKLPEISAAIARYRLSSWPRERGDWIKARRLVHHAGESLGINPGFSSEDWVSPYWIADFKSEDRKDQAVRALAANNIESREWWSRGCHRMPAFSGIPTRSALGETETLARRSLGLPFFRGISDTQVNRVLGVLGG